MFEFVPPFPVLIWCLILNAFLEKFELVIGVINPLLLVDFTVFRGLLIVLRKCGLDEWRSVSIIFYSRQLFLSEIQLSQRLTLSVCKLEFVLKLSLRSEATFDSEQLHLSKLSLVIPYSVISQQTGTVSRRSEASYLWTLWIQMNSILSAHMA